MIIKILIGIAIIDSLMLLWLTYKMWSAYNYTTQLTTRVNQKKLEVEEMKLDSTIAAFEAGLVQVQAPAEQEEPPQMGFSRHSGKD